MLPDSAFNGLTHQMVGNKGRPLYGVLERVVIQKQPSPWYNARRDALDDLFPKRKLQGRTVTHTEWCIESVFPTTLYLENGCDLRAMLKDPRLVSKRTFSAKDSYRSFFGYMAAPRPQIPGGWVDYMLRLWKVKRNRPMPHYYFDVTEPGWAFEELSRNPNQPRSWRVSTACLMAWSFRWDSVQDTLHGNMIMRNMAWSHMWGEFFGGVETVKALMRELKVANGVLEIYSPAVTLDTATEARKWLKEVGA